MSDIFPLPSLRCRLVNSFFFFFNDTATTEIYPLSLHDALPIYPPPTWNAPSAQALIFIAPRRNLQRSEEHTSELQSHSDLVCRLLLEKKKLWNISLSILLRRPMTRTGKLSATG